MAPHSDGLNSNMVQQKHVIIQNTGSVALIIGVVVGSIVFAALVIFSICFVKHQRWNRRTGRTAENPRQFLLPKVVKPVISFKTAAGPGGLKKTPSPVTSPDSADHQLPKSGSGGFTSGSSGHHDFLSASGNQCRTATIVQMDDADDVIDNNNVRSSSVTDSTDSLQLPSQKSGSRNKPVEAGNVCFNLRYNFDKSALMVNIVSATNLTAKKIRSGTPEPQTVLDPYIKLQLLPEKQHKVKTKVIRNTLNPVYDEEFMFYGLQFDHLESCLLHFAVIGFDRYSRDEVVGEVVYPVKDADLKDSEKAASVTLPLVNRSLKFQNNQSRGDILTSLCYQPATNRLTVVVLKARNLPKVDITGLADPYIKVYMTYNGQRIAKKKSHVKKRTLNPVYNESFVFDLPCNDAAGISNISLDLMVMDWDRVTKSEVMGRAEIGTKAKTVNGRQHWETMIRSPRRQVAEWHKLRA